MATERHEHENTPGPAARDAQARMEADRQRAAQNDPNNPQPKPGLPPSGMTIAQEDSVRQSAVRDETVKAQGLVKELEECLTRLAGRLQH